ncbi:MAG: hypothetical protein ACOH1Y_16795 [Propionicimonas sp.]
MKTVKAVANQANQPAVADRMVTGDLLNMARMQDEYIKTHPRKHGFALTASRAGKPLTITFPNDFPTLPGNVVAVRVSPDGYCVSVYNKYASKANKAAKAALFKSAVGGLQKTLGHC